ncbi:diaminopimelate epimerase [uncultured Agrococcus sp.]|uniref:diaminopimelate epimerase n=1 Tax=uncultured Agrococcus sp. TaxID=382258 RepID=UPI0025FB67C3|nr:diaminopimelate epimerase [uncultured Agrococcus sp.]
MRLQFTKGHGTGNDFVLFTDADREVDLTEERVRALTDRHVGVGGDGVIRAVRADGIAEVRGQDAEWFMDYRNGDGSIAEMCGNGVRVFAHYLLAEGLAEPDAEGMLPIATRAGLKPVRVLGKGRYEVSMGEFTIAENETLVTAEGIDVARPALSVDVGNPHRVVALATEAELEALDLNRAPGLDPAADHGANVEFVVPGAVTSGRGSIVMRVHERGVGETQSCGTGAVAAAMATRHWIGEDAPDAWLVRVPGGELDVTASGTTATLAGPAELVFSSDIDLP